MKRKEFISLSGAGIFFSSFKKSTHQHGTSVGTLIPPYLKKGDKIGITSPAGFIMPEDLQPAISSIENWGLKVKIGSSIGKRENTFGGTDEERRKDFQTMLNDPEIKAIMCARGGYGIIRFIDMLDFNYFQKHPKWIIGFSDITVLHSHINRNFGIASIHSKMCNSFPSDINNAEQVQVKSIESIRKAMMGREMTYSGSTNAFNRSGNGVGILVGGNLKTLETLSGTKSDLNTTNKILFVEDIGEYLYSIDRMFWNLKRTGKLSGLKGLIVGGFKIKPDDPGEDFGKSLFDIVLEKVKKYSYPVCFDFPVGHQKENYALKCGVRHNLIVSTSGSSLVEIN